MKTDRTVKLKNGTEIPIIGLGVFKSPQGEDTINAVKWALERGCFSLF